MDPDNTGCAISLEETPMDVLEGEACSSLVGLLGQLADLADHSAAVFAGLHNQVGRTLSTLFIKSVSNIFQTLLDTYFEARHMLVYVPSTMQPHFTIGLPKGIPIHIDKRKVFTI